jgi:hypothetical protein
MSTESLVTELVEREGRAETPFGLYVLPADDPAAELARSVEREVFFEYFGNTEELLADEYAPFESASVFLCVVDHLRRRPAGTIRLILPSPAGFKSLIDLERAWDVAPAEVFERAGMSPDGRSMWDVATLAVTRDYRGAASSGLVSLGLYQGVNVLGHRLDTPFAVAILDLVVLELLNDSFHRPFSGFAGLEPKRYLDSPSSLPVFCDAHDYWSRLQLLDPEMFALICEGQGMETVISTPSWDDGAELAERAFRIA